MPHGTRKRIATRRPVRARLTLQARADQVPAARAFVAGTLGPRHPCAEAAILLTSELVANSIRHSNCGRLGQQILITAVLCGNGVKIEVRDRTGRTAPTVHAAPESAGPASTDGGIAEGGRGLLLVQALAADWGFLRDDEYTTTWFTCMP